VSRSDLSSLFELLPIGAYRLAMDGTLLRANKALVRLNGYFTEAEMRAQARNVVPNPCVDPARRALFYRLLQDQGHVENFDSEVVRIKTGERIWVRENAQQVRDARGNPQYYEGTIEDITAQRKANASMRENEQMLQNILQTIPDRVWLKNLQGMYLTCNDAFAEGLRTEPARIVGTTDALWVGAEEAATILASDRVAMQAGKTVRLEESMRGPDGFNTRWYEIVKTPWRDADGKVAGLVCIARNIQQRKNAEAQLRDTTEQLELALLSADLGRWEHDVQQEIGFRMDERSCTMLGRDPADGAKVGAWGHLVHPDDLPATLQSMLQHLSGATPLFEVEYRAQHADGHWMWLSSRGKVVQTSQDGTPQRMVGTLMDISVRKNAEIKLRETQAELNATLNALPDLLFECSAEGILRAVHSQDSSALVSSAELHIGKNLANVLPKEAAEVCMDAVHAARANGRSFGKQCSLEQPDGTQWFEISVARKPTEPGQEERFIAIARDITERKRAEDAIEHLAFHDSLTGLANRRLLQDRLKSAAASSQRAQKHAALLFLDLDKFKELNDTFGHDAGDLLLQEVARRLQLCSRSVDTLARIGGDEFVLLVQDLSNDVLEARRHASTVGHKVITSLNEPYILNGNRHVITPSVGVTLFQGGNEAPEVILKRADTAMYQAKANGRNTLCFFGET